MTNVHDNDAEFSEHYEAEFWLSWLQEIDGKIVVMVAYPYVIDL